MSERRILVATAMLVVFGSLACTHVSQPPASEAAGKVALERAREELSYDCAEVLDVVGPSQEGETYRYVVTATCVPRSDSTAAEREMVFDLRYRHSSEEGWKVEEFRSVDAQAG